MYLRIIEQVMVLVLLICPAFLHAQVTFVDMAYEWGVTHNDFTCGVGIVDINNDGFSDIITATHIGNDRLYMWDGTQYIDCGEEYGLATPANYHHQISLTDIDKDYLPDFFISGDPSHDNHGHLYINRGYPPFVDAAEFYDVDSVREMGSSFFQFTPDSELGFLCGGQLMVRTGQEFVDITDGSGFETIENVLTPIFFDMDGDYDDDVFIGGNHSVNTGRLYRNNGDTSFTDMSSNTDEGGFPIAQGIAIEDFDSDGDFDIYMTYGYGTNSMWFNTGSCYFINATSYSNTGVAGYSRGVCAGDFDNDGDVDMFVNRAQDYNVLFLNDGHGVFTDVSEEAGVVDYLNGGGCATSDLNNDGQLDIVAVNLDYDATQIYINQSDDHNYLKIKLIGEYPNTLALGAIIKLYGVIDDSSQEYIGMREIRSVTTLHSFDDPIVHFGTGNYESLRVEVMFNSLRYFDTTGVTPGQEITINEGMVSIDEPTTTLPTEYLLMDAYPNPFNNSTKINLSGGDENYTIKIFDILGREIKTVSLENNAVTTSIIWDGTDKQNQPVKSGVYFLKAYSANNHTSYKLTLLK